ncbi:MAG: hypothetical protein Q9169_001265 [Polycauliona sp. 2 TL-2023]
MIVRSTRFFNRLPLFPRRASIPLRLQRRLSFTSAPPSSFQGAPIPSQWGGLKTQLDQIAPRFDVNPDEIRVLWGPEEFYETLKLKIQKAERRIYLSTLYIGKTEHELVSTIHQALSASPNLKVSILTDALRGTREDPEPSCASLLASLVVDFPDQVEIRMYHTPNLTGLRKRFVPKRINEGWGLQHIKLYGIDDEVILSGANLSSDYFTNRQDRYHVFSSKMISDYFASIHHAVCSISFLLQAGDSSTLASHTLIWPSSNPAPSPLSSPKHYISAATSLLRPLFSPSASTSPASSPTGSTKTTTLYPLLSHPPTLNTELPALTTLLSHPSLHSYTFTAGYFNPHPLITSSLLTASSTPVSTSTIHNKRAAAHGTILTASPPANGFFNSPGISGLLPPAYSHLALRFLQRVRHAGADVKLREWQRGVVGEKGGWSYHAKGIWAYFSSKPPPEKGEGEVVGPSVTVIGSSNYTSRSYGLDLEVGALVVTDDEGLMRKWRREEEGLREWTRKVGERELEGEGRRAGWRVRVAMWIVKVVGGSL